MLNMSDNEQNFEHPPITLKESHFVMNIKAEIVTLDKFRNKSIVISKLKLVKIGDRYISEALNLKEGEF